MFFDDDSHDYWEDSGLILINLLLTWAKSLWCYGEFTTYFLFKSMFLYTCSENTMFYLVLYNNYKKGMAMYKSMTSVFSLVLSATAAHHVVQVTVYVRLLLNKTFIHQIKYIYHYIIRKLCSGRTLTVISI